MRGTSKLVVVCVVAACGAGDNRIDPGDLELRDLLGVSPEVAQHWDAAQRESARRVIVVGLHDAIAPVHVDAEPDTSGDDRIVRALAALDARRFADGDGALGVVHVDLGASDVVATARLAPTARTAIETSAGPSLEIKLDRWDAWPQLPGRGLGVLGALAIDAGHDGHAALVVAPAARMPAIAAYTDGRLVVNPVVLAALEPQPGEVAFTTQSAARIAADPPRTPEIAPPKPASGNPYSFYGSVAECAASQRARCEACLPSNTCIPTTNTSDGNSECTMLAANDGRGYFLECINMALAISAVSVCAADTAPSCPRDTNAADSLATLEANANFLDDMQCGTGLDSCLTKIYGAPNGTFPSLVDGGTAPAPQPPRTTNVNCGDSCSSKNENCTASPNCDCSGPSCNNSLSCDSGCSSSNSQSNSCGDCSSNSSGGGNSCSSGSSSSGGGGSCGSTSSGGGNSCSSCSNSSSSGGSSNNCGSCGSSSSSGGSSSNCGSCGSSSSSGGSSGCGGSSCGGSSGGSSCGGGSSGKCSVAKEEPGAGFVLAASIIWGFMPVPFAAAVKRRLRKKKRTAKPEVQP